MKSGNRIPVIGRNGLQGTVDAADLGKKGIVAVLLDSGEELSLPVRQIARRPDGTYVLDVDETKPDIAPEPSGHQPAEEMVIPVVEERLSVGKRVVETGKVQIHKTVQTREEIIEEPVFREEVVVARVPVNRYISEPLPTRIEGDTTIIPIFEEVVVVEKRLLLKEEVHITRRTVREHSQQRVVLRTEDVRVERTEAPRPEGLPDADSLNI